MKSLIVICIVIILSTCACACACVISRRDYKFTFLYYNAEDHVLLVVDGNSGTYISKLKLDLNKDTLSVKAYKGIIFKRSAMNSAFARWKIKLEPNVSFVRQGKTVTPLSELRKFPGVIYPKGSYSAIEIHPWEFPSVHKR